MKLRQMGTLRFAHDIPIATLACGSSESTGFVLASKGAQANHLTQDCVFYGTKLRALRDQKKEGSQPSIFASLRKIEFRPQIYLFYPWVASHNLQSLLRMKSKVLLQLLILTH